MWAFKINIVVTKIVTTKGGNMNIVLFGATGNVGNVIFKELKERGHEVLPVVRNLNKIEDKSLKGIKGDINKYKEFINEIPKGTIVISAMGPVYGNEEEFLEIMKNLIDFSKEIEARRTIVVGGAGSLYVSETLRLIDSENFIEDWKPIARAHINALELLKESELNWTYFSPAAFFNPGEKKGNYKLGTTFLLSDINGKSEIYFSDYAESLVNELENPKNERTQFTIAY